MYLNINDYELLFLINEGNQKALDLFYQKYQKLITKVINDLNIPLYCREEYMQEGLMVLHMALKNYNPMEPTIFYKYFLISLRRCFYRLMKESRIMGYKTVIIDDYVDYKAAYLAEESSGYLFDRFANNELKQLILKEIFIEKLSPKEFAKKHQIPIKKLYNTIYALKEECKVILQDER